MRDDDDVIIDLVAGSVIELAEEPDPTLVEIANSAVVARAAARALDGLESHHGHGPWLVVCIATSRVVATSPSFTDDDNLRWRARVGDGVRWGPDDVPLVVLALGADGPLADDDPASAAAQLVAHALSEIVLAEHRAGVATARAGRAEAMATTDARTGVGNQRAWWHRMNEEESRRARTPRPSAVVVIDLDDLKLVNDERGHLHGDLLLRLAAQSLRSAVRSFDVVARVGGDEFAILAVDFDGDAAVLRDRIARALAKVEIQASIGVSTPAPGVSLVDAYAEADRAMYAVKRARQQQPARRG